jgi:hypothetical protein
LFRTLAFTFAQKCFAIERSRLQIFLELF